MPARRRIIKVYNSKANDSNFGHLGEHAQTNAGASYPRYTLDTMQTAMRYPIIPPEKTLIHNQKSSESMTTNRAVYETNWKNGINQSIEIPKPKKLEAELKNIGTDRANYKSIQSSYNHNFNQNTYDKFTPTRPVKPLSGEHTKKLMEKGIEPIKPYKYHKPCVDVDYKSEIAKFNADQRHNSTFTIGNRTFNNSNSNNHGSQSARDNYSISNDQIVQIRNQLRMKNIGPTDASRLLRPSSKMEFQTQNQSNFDSSRHANLSKMQPIIPKENHALKYEGRIQGVSSTSANYARPSSSCYATEDFYVYC